MKTGQSIPKHLKNKEINMKKLGRRIFLYVCAVWMSFFSACTTSKPTPEICAARQILWESVPQAREALDKMDTANIDLYNRMLYRLTDEHIRLKTHQFDNPDTLDAVLAYFQEKEYSALAGEARYIQGTEWMHLKMFDIAVYRLKEAQYLLQKDDRDSFLLGMTHYRIGSMLDMELSYEMAFEEYRDALQKIKPYGKNRYISCLYRDLARTYCVNDMTEDVSRQRRIWLDSALFYCNPTEDSLIYWNIRYYQEQLSKENDPSMLFTIARKGLDTYQYTQAANRITEYYLDRNRIDSAAYYLQLYAADSSNTHWNNDRYHELHARYTFISGQPIDAYHEMIELYNNYNQRINNESSKRIDHILNQYDLQVEKEDKQQVLIERQNLLLAIIGIGTISTLLVFALVILTLYHRKSKVVQELKSKEKTEKLKQQLKERLSVTQHFNTLLLHNKVPKDAYQVLKKINAEITLPIKEQEEIWLESFEEVTNKLLKQLSTKYPALTKADCRLIMYIYLGFPIHDICIITNTSKDTIWRRRNRIKQHIGLAENEDLDEWIRNR